MNARMWRGMKTWRRLVLAGGVLILLSLGAAFAGWASWRQDQWMREDLLYQTRMLTQTLNLAQLQRLHGNESDVDQPEYRRLKEQLMAAQQIDPNWKWIYLMSRNTNGIVFFQVDSEAYDAPDASPPGQPYEEASPTLQRVFDTGQAADEGPVSDRWGVWVSAFFPLKDSETGELISVVGIDVEANLWSRIRARAMRVPLASCLALVAIWLGGAFMLARRSRAGACKTWFCPHIESFLALAIGLTLTLTAVWLARQTEMRNQKIAFRHLAAIEVAPMVDAAKELHDLKLEGFAAFFENSDVVTAKEFRRYSSHLSGVSEVLDWCWAEAVDFTNRAPFKTNAVFRTGKLDYQIWEKDEQGLPVLAGARKLYYPIVYLSPKKGNQPLLGFDIGSDPLRRAAVETADQTHLPAASDPISFLQMPDEKGIFLLRPVFYTNNLARLKGFVAADLKINSWLRTSRRGNPDHRPMAVLDLFQLRPGQPPLWLGATAESKEDHLLHIHDRLFVSTVRPLLAFGKTYAIVAHPTSYFMALHPTVISWLVGLAGGIVTAAVAWVLGFFVRRRETLARLVDEQILELASSMRRYDQLARQSRTITWEADADGLYTDISPVAEEVLGYPPGDLIGKKHFYDLHPETGREAFKASALEAFAARKPFLDFVNPMATASGKILWVSTNGMPVLNPDGSLRGYQGTDKDVTERKRGEEALASLARQNQEAAERYKTLISASNTGAWEYHDDTAYMWASPEYFAMLGRDSADFDLAPGHPNIEATWLDLLHPDDKERARRDFVEYLKQPGDIYQHTFRMRHADGHWVWILSRGRILRDGNGRPTSVVVGTHIDITESKRAEQALGESEAKYRMLTESMKDVVWTLDTETLRFLYVSPSVEQMRGYTVEEVMAAPLDASLVPEEAEALRQLIRSRVEGLKDGSIAADTFFTNEIHQPHKNGSVVCAEVVTRYFFNEHTGRAELHGVTRDITARKRAEQYREMGVKTLQILNEPDDLNDLLGRLVAMFKEETGLDAVGIRLQNGDHFPYMVQHGFSCDFALAENDLHARDDKGNPLKDAEGRVRLRCTCGLVLSGNSDPDHHSFTAGGSCWTNDAARLLDVTPGEDPRLMPRNRCIHEGYASLALVPIHSQGRIVGLLQFNDRRKNLFSLEIVQTLESLAAHVGEALTRKRAEQDYRTLFHEMLEGFAVHEILCDETGRPVDYRFLALNPTFERMTGLKAQDIVGKTVLEVMPRTEPRWIETYGRVALTGEPAFFQNYSTELGKHFEVTAFRPAPNQFACIFSDITERKRADDDLRESRRQYAALMANLPGMAYRCRNDRSWTMEFVSEGCRNLTGYAPEDLVGNKTISFNELICLPHRDRLWDKWQRLLREHRKFEAEYEITARDGAIRWVWEQGEGVFAEDGHLVALEGFIADITERKRAEIERERLTRAIEQSGDTIIITDAAGSILYVNPAFTRTSGYSGAETLGQNPRLLQSGQHGPAFYREMWKALGAGETWEGQLVNRRKDGSLYTEQASISPVRDAEGRIVHFVAVKRDITQQLLDLEEKEQLQTQLLQAQKMESIGRLAGGVAHDFNNMLQAILGYAEMALEQVEPGLPLHSDLTEIQKAAQRSSLLTRQLQVFARKQAVVPKALDLNAAVESMSDMLRRLIGEKIGLVWKPGKNLGLVNMDPGQLDQVVANLCINARDAIGKSGDIAIETGNVRLDHAAHSMHGDIEPGSYVVLSVIDDGCGMAPDVLDHIFEPFFTTKQTGKGTGLGLATVYGIVKQNRGGIRVRSELGKGSVFQIFLPRHAGEAPSPAPDGESQAPASCGGETILLVEDEEAILQAARRILESLGYQVLATASPDEALQLAEQHKDRIRLLLTDVIMPQMNGPELVRQLVARHPGLAYLYMSGYTANLIAKQGVHEDSANFIQKPFSRAGLAQKVRAVLDGK